MHHKFSGSTETLTLLKEGYTRVLQYTLGQYIAIRIVLTLSTFSSSELGNLNTYMHVHTCIHNYIHAYVCSSICSYALMFITIFICIHDMYVYLLKVLSIQYYLIVAIGIAVKIHSL